MRLEFGRGITELGIGPRCGHVRVELVVVFYGEDCLVQGLELLKHLHSAKRKQSLRGLRTQGPREGSTRSCCIDALVRAAGGGPAVSPEVLRLPGASEGRGRFCEGKGRGGRAMHAVDPHLWCEFPQAHRQLLLVLLIKLETLTGRPILPKSHPTTDSYQSCPWSPSSDPPHALCQPSPPHPFQ